MEVLYYEVNYKLAVEIAERAKDSRVKQFIFMSTATVYGSYTGCITVDTIPDPNTFYGKSKLVAEQDIIKLQDKEYKVVIVRPPMVYGEGCKGNFSRLVKLAKYTPIFPEFHNKRSVININTLSVYLVDILVENEEGYIYPQDDKYFSTCEFIINIKKDMGKKTILFKKINLLIRIFRYRFKVLSKLFGDMYYER